MRDRSFPDRARNLRYSPFHYLAWGLLALAVVLGLCSHPTIGQVLFSSIVGSVTDATGAAVPGATIRITEANTNDTRSVTSNEAGGYTVSTVPAGTYQVEITKEGFRGFITSN